MKYLCQLCIILYVFVLCSNALVHFKALEKGADGCKMSADDGGAELTVGQTAKDKNVCGVYVCQNKEGHALIHYCQKPAPFENCQTDGVSTETEWPQCCWMCVTYVACAPGGGGAPPPPPPAGGGDTPAGGGDTPAGGGDTPAGGGDKPAGGGDPPAGGGETK